MFEIRFNTSKEERKALVQAISEVVRFAPVYKGAPGFEYAVNNYTIDRHGTLIYDERVDAEDARQLLEKLSAQGFTHEIVTDAPDKLVIEVPLERFSETALDNLERLVSGKAALIMKALGADSLPIERTESSLRFPWFSAAASGDEADAYARFVHALCDMAKQQKRVTMKEKISDGDSSEKFQFRCFLLRLGFIGKDYAPARKILLSKLSGSGAFKSGDHKNRTSEINTSMT